MKIKLICVGKLKEEYLTLAVKEYSKRISGFANLEIIEVEEAKQNKDNQAETIKVIKVETSNLIKHLNSKDFNILLDVSGKQFSSEEFSSKIDSTLKDFSTITFFIGGSNGVDDSLRNLVNLRWSFSKLTFPHQLIRVMLLEQIYRMFKINSNQAYHK